MNMMAEIGPTSGTALGPMAKAVRKLVLFERANDWFGGAHKLAEIIGVSRRSVNRKRAADRRITGWELKLVADAAERRAAELAQLAADIREMIA